MLCYADSTIIDRPQATLWLVLTGMGLSLSKGQVSGLLLLVVMHFILTAQPDR